MPEFGIRLSIFTPATVEASNATIAVSPFNGRTENEGKNPTLDTNSRRTVLVFERPDDVQVLAEDGSV